MSITAEQRESYYASLRDRPLVIRARRSRMRRLDDWRYERARLAAIERRLREIGVTGPDIRQVMCR